MEQLYDTYDITQSKKESNDGETIDFIEDVIARINAQNKKMQKILIKKMNGVSNTNQSIQFIEQLHNFEERGEGLYMSKTDETHYYLSQMIVNMIKDMLITFPIFNY